MDTGWILLAFVMFGLSAGLIVLFEPLQKRS